MADTDEPYFPMARARRSDLDGTACIVAVNSAGQYAIWPADLPLPAGWRARSRALPRPACRSLVARAWPDIAPASLGRDGVIAGPGQ
ncbi:MAG TPA: MbtH family NRPS accessory protein, partial [Streptosporangiaceae bacterium]